MNESTWDFLGIVAQEWGLDWARKLRDEIAAGTFVDCGWTDTHSLRDKPEADPAADIRCASASGRSQGTLW